MPVTEPAAQRDLARITLSILGIGVLIVGSFRVLLPFLGALLWATMIVVATWPLMRRAQARLGGHRGVAVAVMTVVLLLVLFVPLYLALATLIEQSGRVADLARTMPELRVPPPPAWVDALPLVGHKAAARWDALAALSQEELARRVAPYLGTALTWFAAKAGGFASLVIHFLLTVVISAILFAKGEGAAEALRRFFRRLAGERGEAIVELSGKAIRAVALGIVVTAAVQTALAGIGLVALGVPFAGLITAVVLVFCIAQVGPLLPLVPCVIWLYATGSPGRGTVLLVITIVTQTIDNVLRPVLIKRGADLSLLLIFPGVIGGLLWLGVIGLFVGPVILAVTVNLLQSWISSGLGEAMPTGAPAIDAGPAVARGAGKITSSV
ncbi:AI-2E family transporter YdiK [Anaeromyxobacter oryzae]|uniref:Membrane protein n=1 Tax=Anaeromyxobacter oryzae TaxID=2918170 RepID=A0ABM7WZ29_9BACT|nr:AI-2E family transporter YdiK [Anaeromyxobacter oryzae]BDG04731.1 membrane protein [Anaeromyxobacter oryzae]